MMYPLFLFMITTAIILKRIYRFSPETSKVAFF